MSVIFSGNIVRLGSQCGLLVREGLFRTEKHRSILRIGTANITSKAFREVNNKPAPYPYKEKNFPVWKVFFDRTLSRFDENTKIIAVEGSVAVGKTKFAKELAKELDMHHIEEANMDILYIDSYGFDRRKLDPEIPPSMQSFDEKNFCMNPKHENVAGFQCWMYRLRYSVYVDALAHLLSTGQGVVIERSPWADKVFIDAMYKNNYISKNVRKGYLELRKNTIHQIFRPHLVIYLDAPVSKIKEKIKRRCYSHEQNSPALTDQYLHDLEDFYKTDYLTSMSQHAELLIYDWSEEGDVEPIVEDIERLDFESYNMHDGKFEDWFNVGKKDQDWAEYRIL